MSTLEQLIAWNEQGLTIREIVAKTGIHNQTLRSRYKAAGISYIPASIKPSTVWDINPLKDTTNVDGQYVIGLLSADGYIASSRRQVCIWLQARDVELLYRIAITLGRPHANVLKRFPKGAGPQLGLGISSKHIADFLGATYGVVPNKSRSLPFPTHLDNPLPYLRGYFDGNGYIGYGCTFSTGSANFAEGLLNWVHSAYQYTPNVQRVGRYKDSFNINFRKKHAQFIHDLFAYRGLSRKTAAYHEYLPNKEGVEVTDKKP